MARTVQKLQDLRSRVVVPPPEPPSSSPPPTTSHSAQRRGLETTPTLDGLMVIAGDWNCDQYSVSAQLLKRGVSHYGNIRDRNYKSKLTKASALELRHPFRFRDAYDIEDDINSTFQTNNGEAQSLRQRFAPITVSLHGRGPGIMDHLFFDTASADSSVAQLGRPRRNSDKRHANNGSRWPSTSFEGKNGNKSKRRKRRIKAESRAAAFRPIQEPTYQRSRGSITSTIEVESILATVATETQFHRLDVIKGGLPNIEQGFPSDHLPVGALFVARKKQAEVKNGKTIKSEQALQSGSTKIATVDVGGGGGVTKSVQRRREAHKSSISLRRRHNVILGFINDWLLELGVPASNIVRDQPLYKNHLIMNNEDGTTMDGHRLHRKSRAPDLVCLFSTEATGMTEAKQTGNTLAIIEIAVASNPERVWQTKMTKYRDLVDINDGCQIFAVVIGDDGSIPNETKRSVGKLIGLSRQQNDSLVEKETRRFCSIVSKLVAL